MAAVKVRGTIRAPLKVRETLQMLNLKRTNYAVLIDNRPSFIGMLRTAQNFITWGEVSRETIALMLEKRGRLAGNKKITGDYLKKIGYNSIEELADAIFNCKVEYWNLPGVQPYFRLHPPTKGFKGKIKKSYSMGGELGYRGDAINELIRRMV
ncbi:50S ribosomal protein L30 [Candidatus Bathyarchaeota archaeon]|nr:50S ribosomal protein L30 [Candidatus Bathyarchaeota archaeon]